MGKSGTLKEWCGHQGEEIRNTRRSGADIKSGTPKEWCEKEGEKMKIRNIELRSGEEKE